MRNFKTRYGHFSADGREYVVTSPRTPRPWINVISNGDYGITVSQTGSGYSWRTHAQLNRITRWEQDLIRDDWGKCIYIRDEKGNLWSAGWKPVCHEPQKYSCRHGIGYSVITSLNFGIESELLLFTPNDEPVEIWKLTLKNNSRRSRRLKLFTYLEWGLGNSPDWHREFHKSFIETFYEEDTLFATKRLWEVPTDRGHWNADWAFTAFHSSSVRPSGWDGDKESFLGMYESLRKPAAIQRGRLSKRVGNGLDPIASLNVNISLAPGKGKKIVFTLGAADSRSAAGELASKYRSVENVDRAFGKVHERWQSLLGSVEMKTPDHAMDLMENIWLKYQALSGRLWGRTAYYQTGGAYGFRDQLQDSQIALPIDASLTLNQLRLHARHQFADGTVYHWWHPISETGLRNSISDNLLWLPYVMNSYLLESNNFSSLAVREPFVDAPEASLYDHCVRAIDRALERMSVRGLPLIGGGDWNDGLSAVGLEMKGESVWLAQFLHRILLDFGTIARKQNDSQKAESYSTRAQSLREAINRIGWEGEWYFGATKDSGEKLGSSENAEGSVWLNPQTWSIIGSVAGPERAAKVMDVVEQRLETEIGPLLLRPAYSVPDKYIGYLTRYSPGMRENGGVYTHAATWAVIASAQLGRGESAYRMYSKLNPIARGREVDRYCAEPYVTSGNIEGPDSPFFGRGGWTWYSGSAAWLFRAGLEWIIGVRPTFDGLLIDPCIPRNWKHFKVLRTFRGARYNIIVENPDQVECGVKELCVDNQLASVSSGPREKIVPVFPMGTSHEIRVVMG